MKIALAQFAVERSDPPTNLERIQDYVLQAKAANASALFMPEMCTTGFGWAYNREHLNDARADLEQIAKMADHNNVSVCGSFLEKTESGNPANTFFYLDFNGAVLAKYRKIHPFTLFHEEKHVESGREVLVADTEIGKIGCSICYDIRFPELFRKCVSAGAEIQILPAAFPYPRLSHWQTLIRARAIENQFFFIAVNQCGYESHDNEMGDVRYFGHSMVVDPWGEILFEAGEEEGLFIIEMNMSIIAEARNRLNTCVDRRPELY